MYALFWNFLQPLFEIPFDVTAVLYPEKDTKEIMFYKNFTQGEFIGQYISQVWKEINKSGITSWFKIWMHGKEISGFLIYSIEEFSERAL